MPRFVTVLFALQAIGAVAGLLRLMRWRRRAKPVEPLAGAQPAGTVTIIVPTLNEGLRLGPLLAGVQAQGPQVVEILVADSHSTDDTAALVAAASARDPRIRLLLDDPLPEGWIGKAWAMEGARSVARGDWLLGLDADTAPRSELAASAVDAAERAGFDAVSFAPRFAGQSAMERWLQPSMLASLIYRFGPGGRASHGRVLANGQCFLVKRAVLERHGGYAPVRASFAEDVSLARHLGQNGARVGFLDGSKLYDVRSYDSAAQMWREWGRSIDLKDASTPLQQVADVAILLCVQGMPLVVLALAAFGVTMPAAFVAMNAGLLIVRASLGVAMRGSYSERGVSYWLSPLSDPLAAIRVAMSSLRRPRVWRGREYPSGE